MSCPRLLLLCEYATLNGGEQSLLATLPTVIEADFEVVVALPRTGPLVESLQQHGVLCVPYSLFDDQGHRLPLATAQQYLTELITAVRPDLLHANSLAMGRLSGPVVHERSLPSVTHLRDIIGISSTAMADLNCHSTLLAVSHATRAFHIAAGLDPVKSRVLYNGVDLQRFRPAESTGYLHRELRLPAGVPLVASVGQLGLRKDPLTFLRAAESVASVWPDVQFLLVGERNSCKQESLDLEDSLHALAAKAPLAGRVHFMGVRNDIAELLPELALLVHAARQEPLGRVLLEAAASGVAIIATNVGGTAEIFPPEANSARLIAPGDASILASELQALLADAPQRQELGKNACRRAEAMFDLRQRAAELVEVYRSLLA